jgi:hypothetical protein
VTKENIHLLSIRNDLESVLRLADSINCCQLLEDCKGLANDLLLDWPPTEAGASSEAADKNALLEFNHVKAMRGFATDIKDDTFNQACYTYVSKRCNAITANATKAASVKDAVSLVNQLSDYPELLRAGFFHALCRNAKYTGKTITRVVDRGLGDDFPLSSFIFKFQITGSDCGRSIEPMADPKHAEFKWNGLQYTLYIDKKTVGCCLNLDLDLGVEPPGPRVDGTFRVINWSDPSKWVDLSLHCDLKEVKHKSYYWTLESDEVDPFLDEDGVLYVLVTDWTVTDPTNPQNAN